MKPGSTGALRHLLRQPGIIVAPGAYDRLAVRRVEPGTAPLAAVAEARRGNELSRCVAIRAPFHHDLEVPSSVHRAAGGSRCPTNPVENCGAQHLGGRAPAAADLVAVALQP